MLWRTIPQINEKIKMKKKFGLGYLVYNNDCSIKVSETIVDTLELEKDGLEAV